MGTDMNSKGRAVRRRERPHPERRPRSVPGLLLRVWVLMLVATLLFGQGEPLPVAVALGLGLLAAALLWHPRSGARLRRSLDGPKARRAVWMLVPAMLVSGMLGLFGTFFGGLAGILAMLVVLVLAAAALVLAAGSGPGIAAGRAPEAARPTKVPALPASAPGEPLALDIRELCRGLPAPLAGEVLATVEHLEMAEARSREDGDARRRYDAERSLRDYLPNTVNAWKGQAPEQRDPQELARALEQIKRIAGADEHGGEGARHGWETQKRFLDSRSERTSLELK